MSQENIETLRHTVDAISRGAWDEARLDFDTGSKWSPTESESEDISYFGYEGVRNYMQSWVDNFDNFRLEILEMVDAGEQVFIVVQVSGQGKQSGEHTSSPPHPLVADFESGKILGLTLFMMREAALQAAGLPNQDP